MKYLSLSILSFIALTSASGQTTRDLEQNDQFKYIKAQKAIYSDLTKKVKYQSKMRREMMKTLLKKSSDQEVDNVCSGQVKTEKGKTLTVVANCKDLQENVEAEKVLTQNLNKLEDYEKKVDKVMGSQTAAASPSQTTTSNPTTTLTQATPTASAPMGCGQVKATDYAEFRLRASYFFPDKDTTTAPPPNVFAPDSSLVSKKVSPLGMTKAYYDDHEIFLDRCVPQLADSYANDSSALLYYKKIYGTRRGSFLCINGQITPPNNAPIKNFEYNGQGQGFREDISCPKFDNGNDTCQPPSWKFEKYMEGELLTKGLYEMRDQASDLPFPASADNTSKIEKSNEYLMGYCTENERLYSIMRTPIFECTPKGSKGFKYRGVGVDIASDNTDYMKRLMGSPFGVPSTWDKVLEMYPTCASKKVDLSKAILMDKYKKMEGIFVSTNSNEEFKVEEIIGMSRIVLTGLSGYGEFKAVVNKPFSLGSAPGAYTGRGLDYPGTCKEVAPFDISVERVSDDELKVTQTMVEDSCGLKAGAKNSFTLKRK